MNQNRMIPIIALLISLSALFLAIGNMTRNAEACERKGGSYQFIGGCEMPGDQP